MRAKGNLFWILVLLAAAATIAYWRAWRSPTAPASEQTAPALPPQAPSPAAPPPPAAPPAAPVPDNACLEQAERELRSQPLPSKNGPGAEPAAERLRRYRQALRRCSVQPSR